MQAVTTIGLDIAKSVFQIHGVDAAGNVIVRRRLKRRYVLPFFQKLRPKRDARSDRSRGGPLSRLGNCQAERFGEAGVAPVVHVQPIRRHKRFERQMFSLVPMPHQVEAAKMTNTRRLRGGGNQRHHIVCVSLGDDLGRVLRINQHDVGASRL